MAANDDIDRVFMIGSAIKTEGDSPSQRVQYPTVIRFNHQVQSSTSPRLSWSPSLPSSLPSQLSLECLPLLTASLNVVLPRFSINALEPQALAVGITATTFAAGLTFVQRSTIPMETLANTVSDGPAMVTQVLERVGTLELIGSKQ